MHADTMRRGLIQSPGTIERSDVPFSFTCVNALTSVVVTE